ncbi:MAG TPA: PilZ domain-containing protein [Candidatus Acidoferrales bacterium]|nr:PilZ domain-containing protein [Candidatus Acidoferrales bacterium]
MHSHDVKKHPHDAAPSGTATADRRNADRHMVTASAEVVELSSGARFSARTTDLGPGGCFVDTLLPFPVGANVRVTVKKGTTHFETEGLVVYSQTGLGMGIAFHTLETDQRQALNDWLMELTGSKQGSAAAHATQGSISFKKPETSAAVVRFVRLLISKGIITEAEGASVLHDPVL